MIVSMGEVLVDLTEDADGRFTAHPGGAPANVALALTRLGAPTRFAGRFSSSRFGRLLRGRLEQEGVDLSLAEDAEENQTLAVVGLDAEGTASYAFYTEGTADWRWSEAALDRIRSSRPAAFHFGSVASAVEPAASAILSLAEELHASGETVTSLDVNIRPALAGPREQEGERIERLVRAAHLVKASDEDLRWLFPGTEPEEAARHWATDGRTVLVTLGSEGAVAFLPSGTRLAQEGRRTEVVDTIGAGDSFCAAVLTALSERQLLGRGVAALQDVDEDSWRDVLRFAVTVSSLTCERAGADTPRREVVDAALDAARG